ncbi:hypothetical protein TgHK011_006862 [Trichoderma gracile]|nr:hypothetical protein TgHK011_006862 [Trichoderma gracile]
MPGAILQRNPPRILRLVLGAYWANRAEATWSPAPTRHKGARPSNGVPRWPTPCRLSQWPSLALKQQIPGQLALLVPPIGQPYRVPTGSSPLASISSHLALQCASRNPGSRASIPRVPFVLDRPAPPLGNQRPIPSEASPSVPERLLHEMVLSCVPAPNAEGVCDKIPSTTTPVLCLRSNLELHTPIARHQLKLATHNNEEMEDKTIRLDSIVDAEDAAKERRRKQNRIAQRKHRRRKAEQRLSAMSKSPEIRVSPLHSGPCCCCVTRRPEAVPPPEDYNRSFMSITSPNPSSSYGPLTPSAVSDYDSRQTLSASHWTPFWPAASPLFDGDAGSVLPSGDNPLDNHSHSPIPSTASLDIPPFQDSHSPASALSYDASISLISRPSNASLLPEGHLGGQFPLHLAARGGYIGIMSLLLSRGARIDAKDTCGRTALHYAADAGHLDAVGMLLSLGANPFLVDSEGCNSLHIAASKGREDIVRVLMERGMDPNLGVGSDIENS